MSFIICFRQNHPANLLKTSVHFRGPAQTTTASLIASKRLFSSISLRSSFRTDDERREYIFAKIKQIQIAKDNIKNAQNEIAYLEQSIRLYHKILKHHFLEDGGTPNIYDEQGNTPMQLACKMNDRELMAILTVRDVRTTRRNNEGKLPEDM